MPLPQPGPNNPAPTTRPQQPGRGSKECPIKELTASTLRRPFARHAHGVEVPAGARMVRTSGQLGIHPADTIPETAADQPALCFAACAAILAEAGMTPHDVVRINAFVTEPAPMAAYMAARDAWLRQVTHLPASTLVIVSGFTRTEFKVGAGDRRQGAPGMVNRKAERSF